MGGWLLREEQLSVVVERGCTVYTKSDKGLRLSFKVSLDGEQSQTFNPPS